MNVDPGQVDRDSTSCAIEFGACRRQRLRPGSLVPTVADNDLDIGMMSRVRGDTFNHVVSARHVLQAEARHGLAGLDEMHVGIDESRSDQPPMKIDYGLPARGSACRVVAADETDQPSVGDDGGRPWLVRRVNASPDEDHEIGPR